MVPQIETSRHSAEDVFVIHALYEALVGHVEVPVSMLVSAAILLAVIGGLGLASMMTIAVVERTREIGVMKAALCLAR